MVFKFYVSLLIFCITVLWITWWGVLSSFCVSVYSSFQFCQFLLQIFWSSLLDVYMFRIVIFWRINFFIVIMKCFSLSLFWSLPSPVIDMATLAFFIMETNMLHIFASLYLLENRLYFFITVLDLQKRWGESRELSMHPVSPVIYILC